jgi:HEPN domain-containing protein
MREAEREARRWLLQATDDRRFAEWVLAEGRFFDKGCFVAQQAGEKALKACLYAAGSRRVFGPNSRHLRRSAVAVTGLRPLALPIHL